MLAAAGVDHPVERVAALERRLAELESRLEATRAQLPLNQATFCVLSGDYERVMAALMLGHMAAALEMDVTIFFTFWGVQAVRRSKRFRGKSIIEKALAAMLEQDIRHLSAGKFNFGGLGPVLFERLMREKKIATPADLLANAEEARIRLVACTTSMEVFGIAADELMPTVTCRGAAEFMEAASQSKVSLFI